VVRDGERVDAAVNREPRVLRVDDALEHDRQRGDRPQPVDVVPRQIGPEGDGPSVHVGAGHPGWQIEEAVAQVPLAAAEHRRVHGHHQRRAAHRLGTPDETLGEAEVGLDVELEPQVGAGLDELLDRDRRRHADDHDHAGLRRGPRGCQLTAGMGEPVERGRRDDDGQGCAAAQQGDTQFPCPAAAQHA